MCVCVRMDVCKFKPRTIFNRPTFEMCINTLLARLRPRKVIASEMLSILLRLASAAAALSRDWAQGKQLERFTNKSNQCAAQRQVMGELRQVR